MLENRLRPFFQGIEQCISSVFSSDYWQKNGYGRKEEARNKARLYLQGTEEYREFMLFADAYVSQWDDFRFSQPLNIEDYAFVEDFEYERRDDKGNRFHHPHLQVPIGGSYRAIRLAVPYSRDDKQVKPDILITTAKGFFLLERVLAERNDLCPEQVLGVSFSEMSAFQRLALALQHAETFVVLPNRQG